MNINNRISPENVDPSREDNSTGLPQHGDNIWESSAMGINRA